LLSPGAGQAEDLQGFNCGVVFTDTHEAVLAANNILRQEKCPPVSGVGTMITMLAQQHLFVGNVIIVTHNDTWDTVKPVAFYQVVEVEPIRVQKIYGDDTAPDYIMIRNVPFVQAANGLGIAECVRQVAKAKILEICPFEAAVTPVPATAAQLDRDPTPARSKRRRRQEESGSEEDESGDQARPSSYRKTEDRKKLNPLAAWLLFDKDRFAAIVQDANTPTDHGLISRLRSQLPTKTRDRILAEDVKLQALLQARFRAPPEEGAERPGYFSLCDLRAPAQKRLHGLDTAEGIERALHDFFQIIATICDDRKSSSRARYWLTLTQPFQALLRDDTPGIGFNRWDPLFLRKMVHEAMENMCTHLNSAFQGDKPVGTDQLTDQISAVWANLSYAHWGPRHQAHEHDRLTLRLGTMDRGRTGRGTRTSATSFGGGASSGSQGSGTSGGAGSTRTGGPGAFRPRGRVATPPLMLTPAAGPLSYCVNDWAHVHHQQPVCDKGSKGKCRYTHCASYSHIPKAELRRQFTAALHTSPTYLAKVLAWLG